MKKKALGFLGLIALCSIASAQEGNLNPIDQKVLAVKGGFAPGYALLDGLASGFQANYPSGINRYDLIDHMVTEKTVEADLCLDPKNAVGLGYESDAFHSYFTSYETTGNGSTGYNQSIDFYPVDCFSLRYYRFLPDPQGRWYLSVSGDYYSGAMLDYEYYYQSGATTILQTATGLKGDGVGASISVGREFALSSWLGLDVQLQLRYAKIPKVTGPYSGGSGTQALATTSGGGLALVDVQAIGQNGIQYAPVDLSGLYGKFSLNLYPF